MRLKLVVSSSAHDDAWFSSLSVVPSTSTVAPLRDRHILALSFCLDHVYVSPLRPLRICAAISELPQPLHSPDGGMVVETASDVAAFLCNAIGCEIGICYIAVTPRQRTTEERC